MMALGTFDHGKIKSLLGRGLRVEVVASAIGCDPSLISHLMADESFSQEVAVLRMNNLTAETERDKKVNDLEDTLLDKLADALPMMFKPRELLAAYATINKATRRGASPQESTIINNNIVNLQINQQIRQKFVVSNQGEILEAGGRTLVPMKAHELLRNLGEKSDGQRYERVAKYLPAAATGDDRIIDAGKQRIAEAEDGTERSRESNIA